MCEWDFWYSKAQRRLDHEDAKTHKEHEARRARRMEPRADLFASGAVFFAFFVLTCSASGCAVVPFASLRAFVFQRLPVAQVASNP
jgi:hypothetical protein